MKGYHFAIAAFMLLPSIDASAQVTPIDANTNRVRVVFTGTVVNDVTQTITIRQPGGTQTPYAGPIPDYPYKVGDQVKISYDIFAPNRAYYSSSTYTGQHAADGIYEIQLTGSLPPGQQLLGGHSRVTVSGGINQDPYPNTVGGVTLLYDANTDSYRIRLADNGWTINGMDAPSYVYDPTSDSFVPRSTSCITVGCEGAGIVIRGTATDATVRAGNVPFAPDIPQDSLLMGRVGDPGAVGGFFSALSLKGLFDIPVDGICQQSGTCASSGASTPVPEPETFLLFSAGAFALIRRSRKKKMHQAADSACFSA